MPFLFSIIYRLFSSGKINKNSENNFALSAYKTRHIDVLFGKPIQPASYDLNVRRKFKSTCPDDYERKSVSSSADDDSKALP